MKNICDAVTYKESRTAHFAFDTYPFARIYQYMNTKFDYRKDLMKRIGPNLTSINFCFIVFQHDEKKHVRNLINIIRDYFPNVTRLTTSSNDAEKIQDELFRCLPNLTHIHLYCNFGMSLDGLLGMKKLKTFITQEIDIPADIINLVAMNNKDLSVLDASVAYNKPSIIHPEYYKNLRKFTLGIDRHTRAATDINWPKLEILKFRSQSEPQPKQPFPNIGHFLKQMICVDTLRYFHLSSVLMTVDGYRELSKFTNLRFLKVKAFGGTFGPGNNINDEILNIIGGYKNLKFLIIPYSLSFDYLTLEKIIKTHKKLIFLDISDSKLFYNDVLEITGDYDPLPDHGPMFRNSLTKINTNRTDKIRIRFGEDDDEIDVSNFKNNCI